MTDTDAGSPRGELPAGETAVPVPDAATPGLTSTATRLPDGRRLTFYATAPTEDDR